jgi:hypothetical protein
MTQRYHAQPVCLAPGVSQFINVCFHNRTGMRIAVLLSDVRVKVCVGVCVFVHTLPGASEARELDAVITARDKVAALIVSGNGPQFSSIAMREHFKRYGTSSLKCPWHITGAGLSRNQTDAACFCLGSQKQASRLAVRVFPATERRYQPLHIRGRPKCPHR